MIHLERVLFIVVGLDPSVVPHGDQRSPHCLSDDPALIGGAPFLPRRSVFRHPHSTGLCFHAQSFNYRSFLVVIEIEPTCPEVCPLEMSSSSVFAPFTALCVHCHSLVPEHFHQAEGNHTPRAVRPPTSLSQPLATTSFLFAWICCFWTFLASGITRVSFLRRIPPSVHGAAPDPRVCSLGQRFLLWDAAHLGEWSFLGIRLPLSWVSFVLWLCRGNAPSACRALEGCLLVFSLGWRADLFVRLGGPLRESGWLSVFMEPSNVSCDPCLLFAFMHVEICS